MAAHLTSSKTTLPPTLGLGALVVFGVGDMMGAGIYALVGVTAGVLGNMAWAGFFISLIAAILTGLTYASLGSKYPKAAGASFITEKAFNIRFISYLVGLAVLASGLTSMAAASRAFVEYARSFSTTANDLLVIIVFLGALAFIVFRGMRESTTFNLICTFIEVAGLLFVISVGASYLGNVNLFDATSLKNPEGHLTAAILLQGAALTFYAFMGFEDMLNVSEEVKDPERTFPRGVIIALVITSAVYMAVSMVAVSVVNHADLASLSGKQGPLVRVVEIAAPWMNSNIFAVISLFAIANTALLNFVMASRLFYGMSRQELLPKALGILHPKRQTPHIAVMAVFLIAVALAFSGNLADLASSTSLLILTVFVIVNAALIRLKVLKIESSVGFTIPIVIPVLAIAINMTLIIARIIKGDSRAVIISAVVLGVITLLYFSGQVVKAKVGSQKSK